MFAQSAARWKNFVSVAGPNPCLGNISIFLEKEKKKRHKKGFILIIFLTDMLVLWSMFINTLPERHNLYLDLCWFKGEEWCSLGIDLAVPNSNSYVVVVV